MSKPFYVPTEEEFRAGMSQYRLLEKRGPVYFEAFGQVKAGWGDAARMTEGCRLLLKKCHWAFYRFGIFDPARLEQCIREHLPTLETIRNRHVETFGTEDEATVRRLFRPFTVALRGGKDQTAESTVATAKALHLLAPGLLPLWDNRIAQAYGQGIKMTSQYVAFCRQTKELAADVKAFVPDPDDCTILKRIDEFNYSAYTTGWVRVAWTR